MLPRLILVSFPDRGLSRPPHGSPGPYVNRGSEYGTTSWSHDIGEALAAEHRLRQIKEWPILSIGVHCVVYAVDDSRAVDAVIAELASDRRVQSAQRMGSFHVLSGDPYASLQASILSMNVERAHRQATGRGVTIAIVDTGVDLDHPDLRGQFAGHSDLAEFEAGREFDNDIHGTAVAGVIAALSGNGQGIVGVAPDARLFALRACWPLRAGEPGASCNSLSIATALDAAIRARPQIINLSLTGPADPLVGSLISAALDQGIVIVVAEPAANEGAPGFVAGQDRVIRVRSAGQAASPGEAAHGRVVAAPGLDVLTTFPHGTYNFISGSSFAAANISGIVALILELRPGLGNAEIRDALAAGSAVRVGAESVQGIDACRVLDSLGRRIECAPLAVVAR